VASFSENVASSNRQALGSLLTRVGARDQAAFAELYEATSRLVYGLILRLLRDASVAEDITMEVYMQVWRTASSFDTSRGSANAWLVTIARSRAIDWIRSSRSRNEHNKQALDTAPELPDLSPDPEASAIEKHRSVVVRQALTALPSDQKHVIELAYYSGLSHSEMAEQLSLPLGTVKSRVRMGMMQLRKALGPYAEGAV
jgi:RNA polymerase sigma-70 factor, ECF subfamily